MYIPFILVLTLLISVSDVCSTNAAPPALFIFGDSMLDAGNNDHIKTKVKANFKPYGIDFGKPNGRFTNDRTIVDIIGQFCGVEELIPPYMNLRARDPAVVKGVNYASGGSGIRRDILGKYYECISMDAQVENFEKTRSTLSNLKGTVGAEILLKKNSLFFIATGSNDLIMNDIMPNFVKPKHKPIPFETFASSLITLFRAQLRALYNMDARKFVIANIPPLGCTPAMKSLAKSKDENGCYEHANTIARQFNEQLKELIFKLRIELHRSTFIYVDTYHIYMNIFKNYKFYGFKDLGTPCCRIWKSNTCNGFSHVCRDRKKYVFWDGSHLTNATNAIIARRIFDGKLPDVSPMNVRLLLMSRRSF